MEEAEKVEVKLQRFKGLGEMTELQLWSTTLDPRSRRLVQITIDDIRKAEEMVSLLMGSNIDARKQYILENYDSANLDI